MSAQGGNAVAKHELIEIIRTTKDRVPLRDTLLTEAERKLDMGSLVPIQKGLVNGSSRKSLPPPRKKFGYLVSNCSISGLSGSITTKACVQKFTTA